jgi:UDP-N-acetylmuramoyl-tripeptide--D-alanyl-D-alanine ligase
MMDIKLLYQKFQQCSGINTDTRNIDNGSMFFALKGPNFDANKLASQAIKKGSRFAIVDDPNVVESDEYILVENSLTALQQLAKYHRSQLTIPVIGITGSNGKTTSKELINAVLSTQYKVASTKGNLNNHIGVPLTLLSIDELSEIAIVEMGANHVGEIEFLCELCIPDYALITNIGKAHLEGFGSFENIIDTKKALYESINKNNGLAFVNKSDPLLISLSDGLNSYYYQDENGLYGEIIDNDSGELIFRYKTGDFQSSAITMNLIGNYNLNNAMAAVAIGLYFKVSHENIKKALTEYHPQNNRSQYLKTKNNELILDAYNANPTSTLAALEHFLTLKSDNKLVVLGDMLELGVYATEEHQKIIDFINENKIPGILVGSIYSQCKAIESNQVFTDSDELIEFIKLNPLSNKTILLKGSRGIKLESLVDYL